MEKSKGVGVRRAGSPYSDQECEEIIRKLGEMLDGEIDPEKDRDFIDRVKSCSYCLEQYEIEKSFKELIKSRFKDISVSNDLVRTIRAKLARLKANP